MTQFSFIAVALMIPQRYVDYAEVAEPVYRLSRIGTGLGQLGLAIFVALALACVIRRVAIGPVSAD